MRVLTIDTSSVTACSGVVDIASDTVISEAFTDVPLTHSQTVLPMTQAALQNAGLTFSQVELLAVCSGPGSFTGVRIGVAAVKGLGFAAELPCAAVSTLEALARNFEGVPFCGIVCAVMDARCRQVYTATFRCENGVITRLTSDEAMSLDDCRNRLLAFGETVVFVGDGAVLCCDAFRDELSCCVAPAHLRYVRPRGIALAAKRLCETGELITAAQLQPLYLRLPQAERELKAKQHSVKS